MTQRFIKLALTVVIGLNAIGGWAQDDPMPFSNTDSFEQVPGYEILKNKIALNFVPNPTRDVNADRLKQPSPALRSTRLNWLELEVEYNAEPELTTEEAEQPGGGYLKDVMVKIHLLTPPPTRPQDLDQELLSIELNYGPIPIGRGYFAVAYLPPFLVNLYGGENAFKQAAIAAELFVDGKRVAFAETRRSERVAEADWFLKGGKTGILLPLNKTPWAMDYWERYPPLKEGSGGSGGGTVNFSPRPTINTNMTNVTNVIETNAP